MSSHYLNFKQPVYIYFPDVILSEFQVYFLIITSYLSKSLHSVLTMELPPDSHDNLHNQLQNKHFHSRPPTNHLSQNPRGKYLPKPLPWSRKKLALASAYSDDARLLNIYLWKSPQTTTLSIRKPPYRKTKTNKDSIKSERQKTQKLWKPHYLLQEKSNLLRNRTYYYGGCSCCDAWPKGELERWRRRLKRYFLPRDLEEGMELAKDWSIYPPRFRKARMMDGDEEVMGTAEYDFREYVYDGYGMPFDDFGMPIDWYDYYRGAFDTEDEESEEEVQEEEYSEEDDYDEDGEVVEGDIVWELVERPPSRMSVMSWEDLQEERLVQEVTVNSAPIWAVVARADNGHKVFDIR
ncbi:hypothetical protein QBC38DRAFT_489464 [Podospora fimiseda]|uniref:Uncharacterized protein n=1 Tax=Podospora fimiseda TaxID=252190 RepID=A0AAN6YRH8_9PEZI|nr:hypothetical protein QBC38DRAFT_489464 [Podospora fimiseda]